MDNNLLWTEFKKNPTTDLKKKLILQYQNLVHYVIHNSKFVALGILDERDYFHYGVEGLSEAIDRFDPDYGTKFETYAIQRIKGKIIDELRKTRIKPPVLAYDENEEEILYSEVSLNNVDEEESSMFYESIPIDESNPEEMSIKEEAKEILVNEIKKLSERERLLISLIYFENLNFKDIAQLLNITVPRVSQLHSSIISKLKSKILVQYK